jgi:hypothetical protein
VIETCLFRKENQWIRDFTIMDELNISVKSFYYIRRLTRLHFIHGCCLESISFRSFIAAHVDGFKIFDSCRRHLRNF